VNLRLAGAQPHSPAGFLPIDTIILPEPNLWYGENHERDKIDLCGRLK
jgi:hypothetical protein